MLRCSVSPEKLTGVARTLNRLGHSSALRHSSIVRGLRFGLPIRLVAALHDTSVAMVEGHTRVGSVTDWTVSRHVLSYEFADDQKGIGRRQRLAIVGRGAAKDFTISAQFALDMSGENAIPCACDSGQRSSRMSPGYLRLNGLTLES